MVTAPLLRVRMPKSLSVWKVMLTKKWRAVMAAPLTSSLRTLQALIMALLSRRQDEPGREDIRGTEGHEDLPAEVHDLVVAEARVSPARQDLEPAEEEHFQVEGQDAENGHGPRREADPAAPGESKSRVAEPGHLPAAEKQSRRHRREDDDLEEIGEHEQAELQPTVLRVEADDLRFAFGHIEGDALRFGHAGQEEDREAEGLQKDAPLGQEAEQEPALELDDPGQAERGKDHDQADE